MRTSKMVFGGLAVAAAVATGSAFTASNTVTAVHDQSAGYGQVGVSGITVTNIAYTPESGDPTYLDTVTFTSSSTLKAAQQTATLTLKNDSDAVTKTVADCTIDDANSKITCSTVHVTFASFTRVGLTVVHDTGDSATA